MEPADFVHTRVKVDARPHVDYIEALAIHLDARVDATAAACASPAACRGCGGEYGDRRHRRDA
jgi:hypothetical protein